MCIVKKILKVFLFLILTVAALVLLAIGGLNIAKFVIYRDYYKAEDALCRNPGLGDGFICQGIAYADGMDVILVSGYMKDKRASRIYVTDLDSNSYYVTLNRDGKTYTGHAGGIAVSGGIVYIANGSRIYSFLLSDVLNASNGDDINIGSGVKINNKASFIYTDDSYLYVGSYMNKDTDIVEEHVFDTAEGTHYAICSAYPISDLSKPERVYSIRNKVQGICFSPEGKVVMSTSEGITSSGYHVYDLDDAVYSGKNLDGAPLYYLDNLESEVYGPAMAEGLDYYDGKTITLTESASDKYLFGKLFFAFDIVSLDILD